MSHGRPQFLLGVACVICGLSLSLPVAAEEAVEQVSRSVNELDQWLGEDQNARQWRAFLRSDELAQQLAKGKDADPSAVRRIRDQYAGDELGLDRPRFVAVKEALNAWLRDLETPEADLPATDLPAAARAAKDRFRPVTADDVARARAKLDQAVQQLQATWQSAGAEATASWQTKLEWDAMQTELSREGGPRPDELERLAALYRADEAGLETEPFAAVRRALAEYAYALRLSGDEKFAENYSRNLDELAKRLEAMGEAPQAGDVAAAARAVGWLERAGQAPQLISAVRRRFHRPNFYATASEQLIRASFHDPETQARLNQPQGLQDNILGTSLYGTIYPQLELNVSLVPSEQHATINLEFQGGAHSQNVGYNGPVTLWTNGYTQIAASKYLFLTRDGVSTSRTSASTWTSSNIQAIDANCGLIEKMAWKRAGKQKGQAEQIASQRASWRFASQVDAQVNERLAEANESFLTKVRNRLARRDSQPQMLDLRSTEDEVQVRMMHATANQLATSTEPPEVSADHDLAVRMHETMVANFGESLLGGETLTDERLVEMLTESEVEVPEELQVTPDKDPWSITFSPLQPVTARFGGNQVKLTIHGRRFTRGDQVVRADIEISADYQLERVGDGSKLTRQGEVSVEYVNRPQLSVGQVAMKTFLRKKFDALFKEEIKSEGLQLPDRFKSIGKLHLRELNADQGWLVMGWEQADAPATPAAAAAAATVVPAASQPPSPEPLVSESAVSESSVSESALAATAGE